MMDKGWEAVRNGDIYCAPRCGGKCTRDDYTHACDEAATLAAIMTEATGLDWTPRVHENLGWHYSVYLTAHGFGFGKDQGGMVYIRPSIRHTLRERWILSQYTCFFNGPGHQIVTKSDADDPAACFTEARNLMDRFIADMMFFMTETKVKN